MKKEINNIFTEIPKTLLLMVSKVSTNDGKEYNNIKEWSKNIKPGENIITINPVTSKKYRIVVKPSALHDSPFFQYHRINNNNNPIPLTEMYGTYIDDRDKSVKMDLWSKDHKIHWVGWLVKSWIIEKELI